MHHKVEGWRSLTVQRHQNQLGDGEGTDESRRQLARDWFNGEVTSGKDDYLTHSVVWCIGTV